MLAGGRAGNDVEAGSQRGQSCWCVAVMVVIGWRCESVAGAGCGLMMRAGRGGVEMGKLANWVGLTGGVALKHTCTLLSASYSAETASRNGIASSAKRKARP